MEKVCALDVHKNSIFACILDEEGKKILEKRYGTLTPNLIALRNCIGRGRLWKSNDGEYQYLLDTDIAGSSIRFFGKTGQSLFYQTVAWSKK
ncbi:MAG TPA: hypothetical protein PLE52_07570 [Paludibacteraceae bacterium]|nr:hypothetical protein [Paludibacteraceae bacterium]